MPIIRVQTTRPLIQSLFELTNSPFEADTYPEAGLRLGKYNSTSDRNRWSFMVGDMEWVIGVDDDGAVDCAVLSFCVWNTSSRTERGKTWEAERARFDRVYNHELKRATAALGPPKLAGQDQNDGKRPVSGRLAGPVMFELSPS